MSDELERAERFAARFRSVYLTFHRRDGPRSQLAGASRAVLEHLAMAGPLTVGEAALFVALPQAPEARRPDKSPEAGRLARARVIDRVSPAAAACPVPASTRGRIRTTNHVARWLHSADLVCPLTVTLLSQ